jgi:beta-lactamase superfamily II metal-dependent hydrolase
MKSLKENPILFFVLLCFFLICRTYLFWISFFLCVFFWYLRFRDRSVLIIAGIFLLFCIPLYTDTYPSMEKGKAIIVKSNYAVLAEGRQRVLVYTEKPFLLDGEYTVKGKMQKIESTKGFFRFDAAYWAHSMGTYYSMDDTECSLIQEHWSIRSQVQKRIDSLNDQVLQENLKRLLLNMKTDQENTGFLNEHGFSYAGMLLIADRILKYFIDRKKRRRTMTAANLVLTIIYHAPMLLVQSLIFRLLNMTKLDQPQKTVLCLTTVLLLYPCSLLSLSFLIPACFRFSFLFKKEQRQKTFFMILCLESIFLHSINPFEILLYPLTIAGTGMLWILGLLTLLFPSLPYDMLCQAFNSLNSIWNFGNMYGSMLGYGLIFFLLYCFLARKHRHSAELWIAGFFVFTACGLFHPLGEVSTINVGQGDSILIREPFNSHNILIDTGKPSQWKSVNDYLHAKGITHLDTLVITHADSDHAGNRDAVIAEYHPQAVIEEHTDELKSGNLYFYDLNTIENEDENESCIVLAARINGLNYLFMGDADQKAEELIAQKYDLSCDVLKLSHHGSKTGSSNLFLDTVRPKLGLISSGAYSIYHHPSPETIQKLLKRHIEYFDTKEEGDLSILMFPGLNFMITAGGKLGIIG